MTSSVNETRKFQSTLPRGERQGYKLLVNPCIKISIHAPARGATRDGVTDVTDKFISIHAPARGATKMTIDGYGLEIISIHAPARGATLPNLRKTKSRRYFNPRSREGSDSKIAHIRNIFSGNYVNLVKICK